jgi:hypothetical protein
MMPAWRLTAERWAEMSIGAVSGLYWRNTLGVLIVADRGLKVAGN